MTALSLALGLAAAGGLGALVGLLDSGGPPSLPRSLRSPPSFAPLEVRSNDATAPCIAAGAECSWLAAAWCRALLRTAVYEAAHAMKPASWMTEPWTAMQRRKLEAIRVQVWRCA